MNRIDILIYLSIVLIVLVGAGLRDIILRIRNKRLKKKYQQSKEREERQQESAKLFVQSFERNISKDVIEEFSAELKKSKYFDGSYAYIDIVAEKVKEKYK